MSTVLVALLGDCGVGETGDCGAEDDARSNGDELETERLWFHNLETSGCGGEGRIGEG